MSTRQASAPSAPIGSKADLIDWIAKGCKAPDRWRIGTEHEKILFQADSLAPVPYDGNHGVRALLDEMCTRYGWQPIKEGETTIALGRPDGEPGGTISLEPGGQFELSGDPLATLHEVNSETLEHIRQVKAIGRDLGIGFLGMGFDPLHKRDDMPTMPKRRYMVMKTYMPKVGSRGLDMMFRTATIQVNLDFASEADMVRKFRVSLALQPVAQAIFAASPFTEGKPNGFKTMRGEIWRDTDKRRTGNLPFVFEPGMSFERYVDYALDVPMYFVYRDGQYIDVAGASFRDFMSGKLQKSHTDPRLAAEIATIDDWSDHLTTLFPDARMKRFLEMRGADSGRSRRIVALPAFWVGLLYDDTALDDALELIKTWTPDERSAMRDAVPRLALDAPFRGEKLLGVAREVVAICRAGLARRARRDGSGQDETRYLAPIDEILQTGKTPADEMLTRYAGAWNSDIRRLFADEQF